MRSSVDYLLAQIAEGWAFRPRKTDLVAEMGDYARVGLATGCGGSGPSFSGWSPGTG
ncbi:hypothetical protein [Micromonospora sediminimaris]|uniref:Uncharacterized protein n=1 Tax=Micromonospora sediminimaris TaxID=547162 RepID=A0A9W5XL15_9ACTN|nr:hypothetical protein [Micromonospora sediminimaris]GIJ35076.1 hypothetical protein Vse01_42240 [Micromonospora sediminimaris]